MQWKLEDAVAYYKKQGIPGDQSALVALLREVQDECGGAIPLAAAAYIARECGVKDSFIHAVIRRIPRLRLADKHLLELCAGPNCGRHAHLASCAEALCRSHPGRIELKFVPCMRMCGKGPNIRWDGTLYHQADEKLLRALAEGKPRGSE